MNKLTNQYSNSMHYDESKLNVDRSGWDFFHELSRYGPQLGSSTLPGEPATLPKSARLSIDQCRAYCQYVARVHYENFQIASWLIPRRLRQDFFNIYAYCRWSDDCADEAVDSQQATALLSWWRGQLHAMFDGDVPNHPVMQALSETVRHHGLPKEPFDALIDAFEQDQIKRRYATMAELDDYCARSANPVGRLVLGLACEDTDLENLRLSDSICTGLQLANFCQDMARDAKAGRIYAPQEMWAKHSVEESMILAANPRPELQSLLSEWVSQARSRLDAGAGLPRRLPRWLSSDVQLFRQGGLAILDAIERAGFDVWTKRPTISKFRKAQLLVRVFLTPRQRTGERT